jgi:hypothetical protein
MSLVHSKYKVIGKLGNGSYSTVHSISMIKGKKQVIRAVKVVSNFLQRKPLQSKSLRLALRFQY